MSISNCSEKLKSAMGAKFAIIANKINSIGKINNFETRELHLWKLI